MRKHFMGVGLIKYKYSRNFLFQNMSTKYNNCSHFKQILRGEGFRLPIPYTVLTIDNF